MAWEKIQGSRDEVEEEIRFFERTVGWRFERPATNGPNFR
jgi:hypothetical protein